MIETRCGLQCTGCEYIENLGCKGCIQSNGNPFHGTCAVAVCCQERGYVHCGDCKDLPCALLKQYSYDKEHGDNGKRIEQCLAWSCRKEEIRYPWMYEYLLSKKSMTWDFKVEWQWIRYLIGGKMYAAVCKDNTGNDEIISLKLEPSEGDFLRRQYEEITPGYYMNKTHWNSVSLRGEVPKELLKEMIDKSYELVLSGFSKKKQKEILETE